MKNIYWISHNRCGFDADVCGKKHHKMNCNLSINEFHQLSVLHSIVIKTDTRSGFLAQKSFSKMIKNEKKHKVIELS